MLAAAYSEYRAWANGVGDIALEWARGDRAASPTKGWPLTEFSTALALIAGYLLLALGGPVIMSGFKPIDSYAVRFIYNMGQVILCSYMCVEAFMIVYRNNYPLLCAPFKTEDPPVASLVWLFYVSKVLDFMDTVFIVLKKSWRQLSFLHVYHHCTIFLMVWNQWHTKYGRRKEAFYGWGSMKLVLPSTFYWLNINEGYDGDVYLTVLLNGFIHTVMYTYYFVSMHTKDIWWKKYLTLMQMAQFVCMTSQAFYHMASGCQNYPQRIVVVYAVYIMSLLALFMHFYIQSYTKKPSRKPGVVNGVGILKKEA